MRDHQDRQSGRRGAGFLRWAERLLVIAGAAMLAWCALLVIDASISQQVARRALETISYPDELATPRAPDETAEARQPLLDAAGETTGASEPPPRAPLPTVIRGAAIGALSIPRVRLSAVVLHGSDARTLRRGPGHLENTALPGEAGNVVIAGHRDSFFRPLRHIQLGDDIFVDAPQGRFHYRVTSLRVVNPHDVSVLEPTGNATLTLITCYPFWLLGHAPDRFIVRATRVVDSTVPAFAIRTTPPEESIRVPVVQVAAATETADYSNTPMVHDDETLVRQAIERFRLTYNARLVSHNDLGPDGPLRFQTCDVTIADDQAAATCEVSSESPDAQPHVWIVRLERADGGWAIRSTMN